MIAAGAGKNAITYRFYRKDKKIEVDQIKDIYAKSVDLVLKSDAFNLVSPFSPETQRNIDIYFTLKKKKNLTIKEKNELQLSIPYVEFAIGYESEESKTEKNLKEYIQKNWQ
jgi:hypothetical protein